MKRTTSILVALCTFAVAHGAHAASDGGDTFDPALGPADVDNFWVVTGFAQSIQITLAGTLTGFQIQADWKPGTSTTYEWTVWADVPDGTPLATGQFTFGPGTTPGSGNIMIPATLSIPVAVGDLLVFGLRQASLSAVGEAEIRWWAGDAPDVYDNYAGTGYLRDGVTGLHTAGELVEGFDTAFDLRLRAWVVATPPGPCASDSAAPVLNTDTTLEVPVGTTQVTVTGGAIDSNTITSITVGGQAATLTNPGPSFAVTVSVAGPGPVVLDVIATDQCGNASAATHVTVTFVDACMPAFDMCMGTNAGTVFYVDVIGPDDEECVVRCATAANGQSLACSSTPICP